MAKWTIRNERYLRARNYGNDQERAAYRQGYRDGFYQKIKLTDVHCFPNAYSAGYWDGANDKMDQANLE